MQMFICAKPHKTWFKTGILNYGLNHCLKLYMQLFDVHNGRERHSRAHADV